MEIAEAVKWADIVQILIPDEIQAEEHMGNTINTKLVGVTHENHAGENIQDILPLLHKGNALAFVREYDNSYYHNCKKLYEWNEHGQ